MKTLILVLILFASFEPFFAQPSPQRSGLVVKQIYVRQQLFAQEGDVWVNRYPYPNPDEMSMRIHHYLLDSNRQIVSEELPWESAQKLGMGIFPYYPYALFIPGQQNGESTPNHRIVLVLSGDTMTIDFMGVNIASQNSPITMSSIYFKPGHFIFRWRGDTNLMPQSPSEVAWMNYYLANGITAESEPYLMRFGFLEYLPPYRMESTRKYVLPKISVFQNSAFEVSILLKGNFLGRISKDPSGKEKFIPFSQIERLNNGVWEKWGQGASMPVEQDSIGVSSEYFDDFQLVRLVSKQKSASQGLPVGNYRISVFTAEREVFTSTEFCIGMVSNKELNPYRPLRVDGFQAPNYSLDNSNSISICTPFYPIQKQEGGIISTVHYFIYDWVSKKGIPMGSINPQDLEMEQFIGSLSTQKVFINEAAYSGKVQFAFAYSVLGLGKHWTQYDVFIVDYQGGKPISVKKLGDVDLVTHAKPMR